MSDGMSCYERDETFCEDGMCLRTGCRLRNERLDVKTGAAKMKTLRVRIPAVIAANGKWAAYGYPSAQDAPDWPMVEEVADNGDFESTYRRLWITVDLPIPEDEAAVEAAGVEIVPT
jgi:hypothetical protein